MQKWLTGAALKNEKLAAAGFPPLPGNYNEVNITTVSLEESLDGTPCHITLSFHAEDKVCSKPG